MDTAKICRICDKSVDQPHAASTRARHGEHYARFGWSGMCAAPRDVSELSALIDGNPWEASDR